MKKHRLTILIFGLIAVLLTFLLAGAATGSPELPKSEIINRGVLEVVKFDISPRLDSMEPAEMDIHAFVDILDDFQTGMEGPLGPQDSDPVVQTMIGDGQIPSPIVSFNGPTNISGVSPPDPNGDVGPNHVVVMSNLSYAVYDKAGNLLLGPLFNNTLWSGFGGDCQTDNSGDPVVLYDQLADRWILTQFTSSGPTYFECVALSQTGDPTGSYYRWAVSTGSNFPDYPKVGVWSDGYYISTREFAGSSFAGDGAYAMNKAQMIAGNPSPTIISFLVSPGGTPYLTGDGLLPADLDGSTLPPGGSPHFFLGSMDNGGQYGAPQDALTLWHFTPDWATPSNSTFTLFSTISIAAYDTQFPCSPGSRSCIPQPGTGNKIDILSYRQRPIFRLAYRNFGSHESLVTNQSVEAAPGIAGNRWWEVRDPNGTPFIYQEGTFAPGVSDGIHRWMGSIAMDQSGNMALGYSASDGTSTFPSVWYTGRLVSDPLGTMPQGEGSIVNGTGSQTGSSRWGDYTSMVIDPEDDCTFWYINEWIPTTSSVGWVLRIGAFRFASCGAPDFTIDGTPDSQAICTPNDGVYTVNIGQVQGYTDPVTLSASGNPGGTTTGFSTNPVTPPGSSTMTIGNTGAASPGSYDIVVQGVAPTSTHTTTVTLDVYTAAPGAPTLVSPANGATGVSKAPTFTWNASSQGDTYDLEVATDAGFTNIVYSASGIAGTSHTAGSPLAALTLHYWRVRSSNTCGSGGWSSVWSFTTEDIPPILLVDDDDDSPDVLPTWQAALDAIGASYDIWQTGGSDIEPGSSDIAPYSTILWFSGDRFGSAGSGPAGPSASTETALASWLDGGGCFFISSQDYHYDKGTTSFMTGYLGVTTLTDDNGDYTSVTGQNVFGGLGPYTLTYPYTDYSDPMTVGNGGVQAMLGNNSKVAGTSKDGGAYKTSYWAFGLEALPVAGQQASLQAFMDWCGTVVEVPDIDVSPASMSANQPANTVTQQTLNISNVGTGTLSWTIDEDNSVAPITDLTPLVPNPDLSALVEDVTAAPVIPAPAGGGSTVLYEAPSGAVLYDNGPIITHPGGGFGGADASRLQNSSLSMCILGFGHAQSSGYRVADDFTVSDPSGWTIDDLVFWAYQTGSSTSSTMTFLSVRIWNGEPGNGGSVIWGDTSTNLLTSTGFDNVYRESETSIGSNSRPIMASTATLGGVFLPQGTYWVDWQTGGTLGSGPWAPPITINGNATTGNGRQWDGASWADLIDYSSGSGCGSQTPQGMPFQVIGSIGGGGAVACDVPEDIPWLSLSPTSGSTGASGTDPVTVTFDSTGLGIGTYDAALCVNSNDPDESLVIVPVQLNVSTGFNIYLPIIMRDQ